MSAALLRTAAGVVVSAGKMERTVKVRMVGQAWDKKLRKHWKKPTYHLVNDPNSSLLEGDVITLAPERHSKRVAHTVGTVVAPFSKPLSERPPLLSAEEREFIWATKRKAKLERRAERGIESARQQLREREWPETPPDSRRVGTGADVQDGKVLEHGRETISGAGLHKYGKINDEASRGKEKAMKMVQKGLQNETRVEEVEKQDAESAAEEALEKQ